MTGRTDSPAPVWIDRLERIADRASRALLALGGIGIVVMMLHICADVAGRYLFNRPITGTLEIVAWYYMVACVFLPLAFVQIQRQHLTVEMFTMGLNRRRLAALDGVVALVGLVYVALLTWLVFDKAVDATLDHEILALTFYDVPAWPSRWLLPASFGLFAVVLAIQALADLWFAFSGRGLPSLERRDDQVHFE
jgi:TRAP-type C4-dicarboxylate transport system permease small subunit